MHSRFLPFLSAVLSFQLPVSSCADACLTELPVEMWQKTDSELKGRWTDPPAEKWPFSGVLESRRIGASRCLSVARDCASVDSTPPKTVSYTHLRAHET